MKFVVACYKFFGLKKDQTLSGLTAEVRRLTLEDREEMAPQLSLALGEEVTPDVQVGQDQP